MALKFFARRVLTDIDGDYYFKNGGHKVRSVLNFMRHAENQKGVTKDDIKNAVYVKYPGLTEGDIHTARALAVAALKDTPEYQRNHKVKKHKNGKKDRPAKFLFDENLSWKIIPEIINRVSKVSSIFLEDMAGFPDIKIWNRARKDCSKNKGRTVVITRDDDFVKLAKVFAVHAMLTHRRYNNIGLRKQPFVVHVRVDDDVVPEDGVSLHKKKVIKAFNKYAQNLKKLATKRNQDKVFVTLVANENGTGKFRGPALPQVLEEFMTASAKRAMEEKGLKGQPPDLKTMNFETDIDWKKLNKLSRSVEAPERSYEDYPLMRVA